MVQLSCGELSEDHPGAAFIRPGRHRYRLTKRRFFAQSGWNRDSLFFSRWRLSSLNSHGLIVQGFFVAFLSLKNKENRRFKDENYIKRRFREGICREQIDY